MKIFSQITLTLVVLLSAFSFGTHETYAQACSAQFPDGTCPTGQRCQVTSMGANNQGVYECVENDTTPDCGSNPNICPTGTQCVRSGGAYSCISTTCSGPNPSNASQTCSCGLQNAAYVWQCTAVTNTSQGSGGSASNLSYIPLEPLPGVNQTGEANFVDLVQGFFRILITVGAFAAVVVLVIGGIAFMSSEQPGRRAVAKERIRAGLIGIGILAAAYLILVTINPQLVMFDRDLLSPIGAPASSNNPNTSSRGSTGSANIAAFTRDCEAGGGRVVPTASGHTCAR